MKKNILVISTTPRKNGNSFVLAYEMCGQMKTLLDRTVPLYGAKYAFRDIYLLATSQDSNPHAMDAAKKGLEGWIACFDDVRLAGVVKGTGADGVGDIVGKSAVARAKTMGRKA